MCQSFSAMVECRVQRTDDHRTPNYLVTLVIGMEHDGTLLLDACHPQSRAVVDDFGTLVFLRSWK